MWYRLNYGGCMLGDEIIYPSGVWQKSSRSVSVREISDNLIIPLDNKPAGLEIYPRFRIRKIESDAWKFERWIFDLLTWADGGIRPVYIYDSGDMIIIEYDRCKLIRLERPEPTGADSARWSDQIILTFQSDREPRFYNE